MAAPLRSFGVRFGAGARVEEVPPATPIQAGPFGTTLLVGILDSGPVGVVRQLEAGRPEYRRIYGSLVPDSEAPLAAEQFYDFSAGHGTLWVQRITDGTEEVAGLGLYDRNVYTSVCERRPSGKLPTKVAGLPAHNGGGWAGRASVRDGQVSLGAAITAADTINLAFATEVDRWKGAILTLPEDDPGVEYVIAGNTDAGVFTIVGTFNDAALGGSDGRYELELTNTRDLDGTPRHLAVEVRDSPSGSALFSLATYRDGGSVKSYEDLSLDSSGTAYWQTAIAGDVDVDNFELGAPTDNLVGSPAEALNRPANHAEIAAPGGVGTNTLTLQVVRWALGDGNTGDPYVDTVNDMTWGDDPRECRIVLTFNGGGNYTVAVTFADGESAGTMPGGTVGNPYPQRYSHVPGWTVRAGATPTVGGDTLTLYVRPLPQDLADKGGRLYIAAAPSEGDVNTWYRITDNDHDTISLLPSVDLSSLVDEASAPSLTFNPGPYNLTGGGQTLIYSVGKVGDVDGPYTLTNTLTGAAETASDVADELNSLELARVSAVATAKLVEFGVSSDGSRVTMTARQDFGADATIVIGAGTINSIVGIGGMSPIGQAGQIVRLQWRQELGHGYDGSADVDDDDYVTAWDTSSDGALFPMLEANTGLVRAMMPGVTSATPQQAMMAWAYETNGLAYVELPDSQTTESGALAWYDANLATGDQQRYAPVHFPSYGDIDSPYGSGLYTASLVPMILGLTARKAGEANGYHLAPAGDSYTLSPTVKALPTGDRVLDNELLNRRGFIEVRKRAAVVKLWGGRIPTQDGPIFLHQRATLSHVGRVLLTQTTGLMFLPTNEISYAKIRRALSDLFRPWWQTGWFDDSGGPAFEDAVAIKVDATNNPKSQRDLGNIVADIGADVVGTGERVIFRLGARGVSESG